MTKLYLVINSFFVDEDECYRADEIISAHSSTELAKNKIEKLCMPAKSIDDPSVEEEFVKTNRELHEEVYKVEGETFEEWWGKLEPQHKRIKKQIYWEYQYWPLYQRTNLKIIEMEMEN